MRKLALLAIASIAFVACQKKTEETTPVDTTAVVAAPVDTAAKVDTAKKAEKKK